MEANGRFLIAILVDFESYTQVFLTYLTAKNDRFLSGLKKQCFLYVLSVLMYKRKWLGEALDPVHSNRSWRKLPLSSASNPQKWGFVLSSMLDFVHFQLNNRQP
jgi:hypothetical protein